MIGLEYGDSMGKEVVGSKSYHRSQFTVSLDRRKK